MGKSQETYNKKEKEKQRLKKRQAKQKKQEERKLKSESDPGGFDSMIAYVDENGNITDTPPDLTKKKKVKAESIEIGVPKMEKQVVETVRKGRVEFFNDSKGFGFIKETGTQEKFFVHINEVIDEIRENDNVSFELERGRQGMNAVRVRRI